MKHSITMTEPRKQQIIGLGEDYIDHYCGAIPSIKLLEQHKVFGDLHADDDLAMAWFLALVMLQADKKAVRTNDENSLNNIRTHLDIKNGRLAIVDRKNNVVTPIRNRNIPRSIFGR